MRKKIIIFLSILLVICLVMSLTGCDAIDKIKGLINGDSSFETKEESTPPCEHAYVDTEWKFDETNHWHYCTKCDEKIEGSLAAHTFGEPQVYQLPTCTTDGVKKYTCTVCGYYYTDIIPSSEAHDWQDVEVTKDPSCTEKGILKQQCSKCHEFRNIDIDMIPHTTGTWLHDETNHFHYCTACEQNVDVAAHNYEEQVITPPDCINKGTSKFVCKVCGYEYVDDQIPKLGHIYQPSVLVPATCTSDGIMRYTCTRCPDYYDEVIPSDDAHDFDVEIITPATCYNKGQLKKTCKLCTEVFYEEIPQLTHDYQGYVCVHCHKDKFLDYQDDFNNHGNSSSDPIQIDSEEEMIAFFDYLLFKESTASKSVKINYTPITKANLSAFTSEVSNKATASTWNIGLSYPDLPGELPYVTYSLRTDKAQLNEKALYGISDSKYADKRYTQQDSIQFSEYANTRSSDYSTFKYLNRINEISVSSSDQLYWAFEHGYKPVPVASSPAEDILNVAKELCKDLISDTMTDREKLIAFYQWFVKEIQYDNGAFESSNLITTVKFKAWYSEGVFYDGTSVCDGMSKAFCILAGIEDIQCIRIVSHDHAWNRVYIDIDGDGDKEWSGVDVTWGNLGLNGTYEVLSLDDLFFTNSYKEEKGETAINFVDANCDAIEDYNIFKYLHYGTASPSSSNDFIISSQTELNNLMNYFKTTLASKTTDYNTVNVLITFCSTKEQASDAIDWALTAASLSGSYFFNYQDTLTLDGSVGLEYIFMH